MKKDLTQVECQSIAGGFALVTSLVIAALATKGIDWVYNKVANKDAADKTAKGRCNCYNENNKIIRHIDLEYSSDCADWCCIPENKSGRWTLSGSQKDAGNGSC